MTLDDVRRYLKHFDEPTTYWIGNKSVYQKPINNVFSTPDNRPMHSSKVASAYSVIGPDKR